MSSYFQIIVDRDATLDEAKHLADTVLAVVVKRGVVDPTPIDETTGRWPGYPPGPNYESIIDEAGSGEDKYRPGGMEIIIGKTVFHSGGIGPTEPVCPRCGTRQAYDDGSDAWISAIDEWFAETGPGLLRCPNCGHTEPITEWPLDPPWGFGNLGFKFWNWPQLTESFIEEVSVLLGHRTVYVYGKV
jgi:hypothetical protein